MNFEANRPVKTSQKTFEIIEHLSRTDQIRLSKIADQLDISKGIVHNHLSTLRELGYVRKIGEQYQLTPKLLTVGFQSRSHSRLFNAARVPLTDLVDTLDTGLILSEYGISDSIVIDTKFLPDDLDISIGTRLRPEESLPSLVAASAASQEFSTTIQTEYDQSAIIQSLSEHGYAVGSVTSAVSFDCVTVPIVDDEEYCYGCVAVVLSSNLSDQERQRIIDATVQLRTQIERRLDSGWQSTRSFATEKHSWIS